MTVGTTSSEFDPSQITINSVFNLLKFDITVDIQFNFPESKLYYRTVFCVEYFSDSFLRPLNIIPPGFSELNETVTCHRSVFRAEYF